MKLSRLGICSRSEGTFGLSRVKCVLSNWTKITCLIWPDAEFSWQAPTAELVSLGAANVLVAKPANAAPTSGISAARLSSLRRRNPFTTDLRFRSAGKKPAFPKVDSPRSQTRVKRRDWLGSPVSLRQLSRPTVKGRRRCGEGIARHVTVAPSWAFQQQQRHRGAREIQRRWEQCGTVSVSCSCCLLAQRWQAYS